MGKIQLPLCKSPIRVYSNYAYILSVLLNNEEALGWFYSNFIQVKYIRDTKDNKLFIFNYSMGNLTKYFYNVPYLQVRSLERRFLLQVCDNVIVFLCNAIKEGYYLMTVVDNFFLPPKLEYNKIHNLHLIMIYGFNMEEQCFYSAGFDGKIYEETKLAFDDFDKAISSFEGNNRNVRDDLCMLYKLQKKEQIEYLQEGFNYFSYKFDLKLVIRSLKEYLNSIHSDEHFCSFYNLTSNSEYGISYYEAMAEYIQKYLEGVYEGDVYDVAFHGMLEHKEVMIERLKYMQKQQHVCNIESYIEAYGNLIAQSTIIRNLVLKYNITKNLELLKRVKKYLNEMYILEKSVVEKLIEQIE